MMFQTISGIAHALSHPESILDGQPTRHRNDEADQARQPCSELEPGSRWAFAGWPTAIRTMAARAIDNLFISSLSK
jgi:hypothetical protein